MISTVTYNGDGATRVFPVAFEIRGEDYVVVFINGIGVSDRSKYDIINNSIVFRVGDEPVIGTNNVEIVVATSPTEIADLNAPPSGIQTVLDNLADITAVAEQVVPNLPEILLADYNASIATTQAVIATTQAGIATTKASEATTSAGNALTSENNAESAEANALSYKNSAESAMDIAVASKDTAVTKAGEASTSASQALEYRNEAEGFADSINPAMLVQKDSSTGAAYIPVGTTAQRPASPANGYLRYNTDLISMEAYSNGSWGSVGGGTELGYLDGVTSNIQAQLNTKQTAAQVTAAITAQKASSTVYGVAKISVSGSTLTITTI